MQRKKCLSEPREAKVMTVASAVHQAFGNGSGTESRPCQSYSSC